MANEIQRFTIPKGGGVGTSFTLDGNSVTYTDGDSGNDMEVNIAAALDTEFGSGNTTIGVSDDASNLIYTIEFIIALANTNITQIVAADVDTGFDLSSAVVTLQPGGPVVAGELERPRAIYSQPKASPLPVIVRANTAQISSGTSAKTILQIVAAANQRILIRSIGVSFEGINRDAAPVQVVVVRQSDAGAMSSLTLVKDTDSDDETIQTTAQHTATAEPSSGDVLQRVLVHPRGGRVDLGPFRCKGDGRLGVVVTAGESVDCVVSAVIEE